MDFRVKKRISLCYHVLGVLVILEILFLKYLNILIAKGIGFLSDIRRMNVSLTRAKSSMIILGNVETLSGHFYWRSLIEDAEQRGLLTKVILIAVCFVFNLFQFDDILFGVLEKNAKHASFCNSSTTHNKEKISNEIDSVQEDSGIVKNFIEDSEIKTLKNSCLQKNSFSQNSDIFGNEENKKEVNPGFIVKITYLNLNTLLIIGFRSQWKRRLKFLL